MEAAAAALLAASVRIGATGAEIQASQPRLASEGPFFREFGRQMSRTGQDVRLGAQGLRTVVKRLQDDAERERAARIADGTRHELGPRRG
jgi:hypothetical protein